MIKERFLFDKIVETTKKLDPVKSNGWISFLNRQASFEGDDYELDGLLLVENILRRKPLPKQVWDLVFDILYQEVEDGNHWAMNKLGTMYYTGTGCDQDFTMAVIYYKLAAENGNREAQENLGYCYYYGRNVPVDYQKAFHYFSMGAFNGELISLYKIGDMYMNGYYVDQNEVQAVSIYLHCLDLLDGDDTDRVAGPLYLRLGDAYFNGKGVKTNLNQAIHYYHQAEMFLYDMVREGDVMYKKSLLKAIEGQNRARMMRMDVLPEDEWKFDQ